MKTETLFLIDSQSLFYGCRDVAGEFGRTDFEKLFHFMDEEYGAGTRVVFVATSKYKNNRGFINFLKHNDCKVKQQYVDVRRLIEENIKSAWSKWIAENSFSLVTNKKYSKIVIVSGAGEFLPIISAATANDKDVFVLSFPSNLNPRLEEYADVFVLGMDFVLDEEAYKKIRDNRRGEQNA